jgi:hypothetical protein
MVGLVGWLGFEKSGDWSCNDWMFWWVEEESWGNIMGVFMLGWRHSGRGCFFDGGSDSRK